MKTLKLNEQKMKKVLRGGAVLTTAFFSVVSFSGCAEEQVPSDYPSGLEYIDQENNDFESLYKIIIRDGKTVKAYNKDNISITIDKDTFEVKEYLYVNNNIFAKVYDFETGYLIVDAELLEGPISMKKDKNNLEIILDNEYEVEFNALETYGIESENIKDFYTLEEIRKLEPKLVESVKIILEYEKGQQLVKKPNKS